VRGLTKELYDLTKGNEEKKDSGEALPELIVDHFDDEQVWQQLELQNADSYDTLMSKVSRLMAKMKAAKALKLAQASSNSNLDLDEEDAEDELSTKVLRKTKRKKEVKAAKAHIKSSVVDDKFFKLQQMEEFLLKEEAEDKVGSDEESVDLFADDPESEDDVSLLSLF
jgi:U3 small nucleolar RNA-associated protein MPP10